MRENKEESWPPVWLGSQKGNGRLCPGFIHLEKRKGMQNRNTVVSEDWLSWSQMAPLLSSFFFLLSNLTETMLVTQLCPILCDPWTIAHQAIVHGIPQARILESAPFPSPRDLPNPGIELASLALLANSLQSEPPRNPQSDRKYTNLIRKDTLKGTHLFLRLVEQKK